MWRFESGTIGLKLSLGTEFSLYTYPALSFQFRILRVTPNSYMKLDSQLNGRAISADFCCLTVTVLRLSQSVQSTLISKFQSGVGRNEYPKTTTCGKRNEAFASSF